MSAKQKKAKASGIMKAIVMPDDLWDSLRMQAIREKTSASEIVRRLVTKYLEQAKKKAAG